MRNWFWTVLILESDWRWLRCSQSLYWKVEAAGVQTSPEGGKQIGTWSRYLTICRCYWKWKAGKRGVQRSPGLCVVVVVWSARLRERPKDAGSLSRATKCTDAICLFASGQKPVALLLLLLADGASCKGNQHPRHPSWCGYRANSLESSQEMVEEK